MITFTKIASYELRPKDRNVFEYLTDVASQVVDPPPLEPGGLSLAADIVFHSTLRRATESIRRLPAVEYIPRVELKEVVFDMRTFCNEATWSREGSVAVRRGFKAAFIADTLSVPRTQLFEEIRSVLLDAKDTCQRGRVVVVSHSFRLKLIEAYLRTQGRVVSNPELIHEYINDSGKTYSFEEGFEIDESEMTV
ncbi:MAG: hypothetical protein Q7S76_01760 [bacterium]|nr:hypothetical protein [bacterium]